MDPSWETEKLLEAKNHQRLISCSIAGGKGVMNGALNASTQVDILDLVVKFNWENVAPCSMAVWLVWNFLNALNIYGEA